LTSGTPHARKVIRRLIVWLIVVTTSVSSCKTPTATVASAPTGGDFPDLPMSEIFVPVKVYLKPLLDRMDSSTSREFTSDKWPGFIQSSCDFRYKYRFVRSPFTFTCTNNRVNISFRGQYQIAGSKTVCAFGKQVSPWVSGSCGFGSEPLRRVDVHIGSTLQLLPGNQLKTSTRMERIQAHDKCEVSIFRSDITGEVMDSIRSSVDSYVAAFDQFVQSLNNQPALVSWRGGGSRVLPVSKYGYLNLSPTALNISPFNYVRDTLQFVVGFRGFPRFSSDSMSLVTNSRLPNVTTFPSPGHVNSYIDISYNYDQLTKILSDSLNNKVFDIEGRTFVIRGVNVSGTDAGKVAIDVRFAGNRSGTLHLAGTPQIDTTLQVLTMPDVTFSVESRDMMLNIAKGLLRKRIMRQLRNKSVFDLAALIARNKEKIEQRLNQRVTDWMSTSGTLNQLRIMAIRSSTSGIRMRLHLNGSLTLIGHPPPLKMF
jgi:hypothetical protein